MKHLFTAIVFLITMEVIAQPKTDCVCNGSSADGGKIYIGAGGDFHLGFFENDDHKYSVSSLGFGFHAGFNFNKKFSLQLGIQKYGFSGMNQPEKLFSVVKYSYLDLSLTAVHRFIKRGSRFIPYIQGGYTLNSTLKKEYDSFHTSENVNGFSIQGHYVYLGMGTLFVLANQFTLFTEGGMWLHPSLFTGTYIFDIFRMKPGISVGVNYHF